MHYLLKETIRDIIQSRVTTNRLGLQQVTCELTADGRPMTNSGLLFIGIHGGGARNIGDNTGYYLREQSQIIITTTLRCTHVGPYHIGNITINNSLHADALDMISRYIRESLHQQYARVVDDVNSRLDAAGYGNSAQYVAGEGLNWEETDEPTPRNADWFDPSSRNSDKVVAYSQTSRLIGPVLHRSISNLLS